MNPEMWERLTRDTLHQIRWTNQQFRRANKPLVYIFWTDEDRTRALYIGKSKNGLSRPMDPAHHRREVVANAAVVEFLICSSDLAAEALEARLIRWLHPEYNVAHNSIALKDIKVKIKRATPIVRKALERQAARDAGYTR